MAAMPDSVIILLLVGGGSLVTVPLIMWVIARMSGWRSLAEKFPAAPPAADADRGFGSVLFSPMGGYNNCIIWRADDDHLHLRVMVPFNIFHKPISVPWAHVEIEPKGRFGMATIRIDGRRYGVPPRSVAREIRVRRAMAESAPPTSPRGAHE